MNTDNILKELLTKVAEEMGERFEYVQMVDVNQIVAHRIQIKPDGVGRQITPSMKVHLQGLEKFLLEGKDPMDVNSYDVVGIAESISQTLENGVKSLPDVSSILDIDVSNLFLKAMSSNQSEEFMQSSVYFDGPVDSIKYFVYSDATKQVEYNPENAMASFRVAPALLREHGIEVNAELFQLLKEQTLKKFPVYVKTLADTICELHSERCGGDGTEWFKENFGESPEPEIYVVTNEVGINGATSGLLIDDYSKFYKQEGNAIIVPSSIHELLLIPENDPAYVKEVSKMVKEVNTTAVEPNEILAEEAFWWDATTKEMKTCNQIMKSIS